MEIQEEKKKFNKMLEEMLSVMDSSENLYPEMEVFCDWMEKLQNDLMKTLAETVKTFPEKAGAPEAIMLAVGRFVCTYLEKLQAGGFVTKGIDIYEIFKEVILPVCRKMVQKEMQDSVARVIFMALQDGTLTEEEIYEKYVGTGDKEEYLQIFRETREKLKNEK